MQLLIADADRASREGLIRSLKAFGYPLRTARTAGEALGRVRETRPDVLFVDTRLPDLDGHTLLERVKSEHPRIDVILMTVGGSYAEAVSAIKLGATDYLVRPLDIDALGHELQQIAERRALQSELAEARQTACLPIDKAPIVGRSEPMMRLFERLDRVAGSRAPILIRGESGTGKELVARWIHQRSPRASGPFVAVNCAALPDSLLEAELFGHERGAFTGATRARKGRFQMADGGTIFLDEVAEISASAQAKLLRVLQEGEVEPLGGAGPVRVDVRLLSATHRDLRTRIQEGRFREDLFYRIKVLDVALPPLRERMGDLPILVEHFLRRFATPGVTPDISPRAWAALANYGFPGNVRELEHAVQHAVVLAGEDNIDLMHLPTELLGAVEPGDVPDGGFAPLGQAVREFEREYLRRALALADNNRTRAASLLGISRKNLWEKLKHHGLP